MKDVEGVTEYITTEEAAKKLGIQLPTLRKYAGMIDKNAKSGKYFERDDRNYRLYTNDNITTINQIIALKSRPKMTIETAIEQILNMEYNVDTLSAIESHNADNDDITSLQKVLVSQNDLIQKKDEQLLHYDNQIIKYNETINQYEILVKNLMESNINLANQVETMINNQEQLTLVKTEEKQLQIEKDTEKQGFFSRLFKR
ncbi:MerR family transcriptional regulator [Carnobacterium jeotgali]